MEMKPITDEQYRQAVRKAVRDALAEDRVNEDVTTHAVVPGDSAAWAGVIARQEGVLAGCALVDEVFRVIDPPAEVTWTAVEGETFSRNDELCRIAGPSSTILRGERSALNFLMRLSGVATLTAAFVERVRGSGTEILDTRKTTPGLRILEKRAVIAGGGVNHRLDLASLALLKENHIAMAGGIERAVALVRERSPGVGIEVEVENMDQLEEVLPLRVDRVMLDNFRQEETSRAVERIRRESFPPYIEVSGGVGLDRVHEAASLGVDGISVGSLTHSAPSVDLSLLFTRE